jgi:type II secretory pathway pseudopilin PulG
MRKLPDIFLLKSSAKNSIGFTLVEMLVAIGILIILLSAAMLAIDPITQIKKAHDSQRKHDLLQIRDALDTYYNDHSCYPAKIDANGNPAPGIPFGQEWNEGGTIYMKKVPQEKSPYCEASGSCYYYYYQVVDDDPCPQWAILYAKLEIDPKQDHCIKKIIQPMCDNSIKNTDPKLSYCLVAGQIDCIERLGTTPPGEYTPSSTTTTTATIPPSTSTTTTTTTLPPACAGNIYWACTGAPKCNRLDNDPLNQCTVHGGSYNCYCNDLCRDGLGVIHCSQ